MIHWNVLKHVPCFALGEWDMRDIVEVAAGSVVFKDVTESLIFRALVSRQERSSLVEGTHLTGVVDCIVAPAFLGMLGEVLGGIPVRRSLVACDTMATAPRSAGEDVMHFAGTVFNGDVAGVECVNSTGPRSFRLG
jgi:hypothetical protein